MDYLITGGNGLLGSPLVARLLQSDPAHRVACLVRGESQAVAERRLAEALSLAIDDAALESTVPDLMARIRVLCGDLHDTGWLRQAAFGRWLQSTAPLHIIHSAANI